VLANLNTTLDRRMAMARSTSRQSEIRKTTGTCIGGGGGIEHASLPTYTEPKENLNEKHIETVTFRRQNNP
jgi:hypothetical protein